MSNYYKQTHTLVDLLKPNGAESWDHSCYVCKLCAGGFDLGAPGCFATNCMLFDYAQEEPPVLTMYCKAFEKDDKKIEMIEKAKKEGKCWSSPYALWGNELEAPCDITKEECKKILEKFEEENEKTKTI